jgi:glycosyltransferase involved in cell wall biosynthesis
LSRSVLMWEHHAWDSPIRVGGRAFAERFLEAGWSVAWMNGPLAPWNLLGGNDEVRRRRTLWRSGGAETRIGPGRLFRYAPLGWAPFRAYPILERPWFHRHALDGTCPPLFRRLAARGFERVDLLWLATGSPFLPLLDRISAGQSLYRLSDETSAFPDTPGSYRELEEEAMRRVDVVVATAASLAERARRFARRVLLLPNGVDLARFDSTRKAFRREGDRRRVVYLGAVDSWLDTDLLAELARALPEVEFRIAGPLRIGTDWARSLPNLTLLGARPPETVPELLAGADVGIIPFVDSPLTRAIHPVKLYEYFASGLPVVATDLEEIRRIGSPARLARSLDEWVDALREAGKEGRREEYRTFAAGHDWSRRFAVLMSFLEEASGIRRAEGATR